MYKEKIEPKKQIKTPKRILNQALQRKIDIIGRKNRKIQDLQRRLRGDYQANELARMKLELTKSKSTHKKLIAYHRNKAEKGKIEPTSRYQPLQKKLKEMEDTINNLEYENLTLKEQVKELQSKDNISEKG